MHCIWHIMPLRYEREHIGDVQGANKINIHCICPWRFVPFCQRQRCILCYTCEYRVHTCLYLVCTVMDWVYTCMYCYILVYTGTYRYIPECLGTYLYVLVHTGIYRDIPVCTGKFAEKQKLIMCITTGFEPITSCIVCGISCHCATSVHTLVMWNVQTRLIYIVFAHGKWYLLPTARVRAVLYVWV